MDLTCLKISAPINNECETELINDFYRIATILPYDEVDESTIVVDGCSVKFDLKAKGGGVLIKDPSNMPFNGTGTTSEDKSRLVYNQSVMLPIIEKTPENAKILDDLVNSFKRVVVILKHTNYNADGTNAYVVYGHETGLYFKENKADPENLAAYHLTLASNIVGRPDYFFFDTNLATTVAKVDSFSANELIQLNIASGAVTPKKVYLKIDSDKTAYIKMPNGTLLTSTSGVIDTTYTGYAGVATLSIPKTSVSQALYNATGSKYSDFSGEYITNAPLTTFNISSNALITSVKAYKAKNIVAVGCALTAKAIGDQLMQFARNNATFAGTANFSGGTNADEDDVNAYLVTVGTTLEDVLLALGTWTITLNA